MIVPFISGSYQSQSPNVAAQRCVNWYPEIVEASERTTKMALYPTPGFKLAVTLPAGPVRALYANNGRVFAVGGGFFLEVSEVGGLLLATVHGNVTSDSEPATICSNGDAGHQLLITSGGDSYIFDTLANTLAPVTTGGDANCGVFVDGYYLALDRSTATLYVSKREDGTTWAGDVGQRNTAADRWVNMVVSHREVWLFGSQRTDVWYNTGDLFPFAPVPGAFIQQGIAAPWSAAALGNRVIWLGSNEQGAGVVWAAQGYQPVPISDKAIAYAIQHYTTIEDAVAWVYQDQGHGFYVLNFPTEGATWVWDDATGLWHERGWWNSNTGDYDAYRASCHVFAFGKHLVGDSVTGAIYDMDILHYTDAAGVPLRRMRQGPHLCNEQMWHFYHRVHLDLETGIGDTVTTDPLVLLDWSDDSGRTWSTGTTGSAGATGAYRTRVFWQRLGRSRDRIFRVVVSDPVPWRLVNFYADIEKGTS